MINWSEIKRPLSADELGRLGLVSRPNEETQGIIEYVDQLAGEDTAYARWLLSATMYRFSGQTWGESLWCAEDENDLIEFEEVTKTIYELACGGVDLIRDDLLEDAKRSIIFDFGDAGLYLAMVEDLLGPPALEQLVADFSALAEDQLELTGEEMTYYRKEYDGAVGLMMKQWRDEVLLMRFSEVAEAWAMIKENWEKPDQFFKTARINTAIGLETLIKEMISRGLVARDKDRHTLMSLLSEVSR